jgi:hypothetical protein
MITDEEYGHIRPGDIIAFPTDTLRSRCELIVSDVADNEVRLIDGWDDINTPISLERVALQRLCRLGGRAKIVIER